MIQTNSLILSEEKCAIWAKAGKIFPGEKLNELVTRTLADLPTDRALVNFYEIRRRDVPTAFDALLKLQNTGLARRYIEAGEKEFWEVLRVEVTLLDAIMLALALLLDVILNMLSPDTSGSGKPPLAALPEAPAAPGIELYVPTWKRQPQRISYDEPLL
ncbi:hypothetical protein ACIOV9_12645 [Pseudomonas iridis]|uniref:hypothetical protein n=1 Tax=Pseudomonas TaxID=286 RepID=UPI00177AC746|nr:hypothetical protein [Pseudomonas sp. PDM10]MBD9604008.1 hypothetical protein [Pseudomonas sp. PDM10]